MVESVPVTRDVAGGVAALLPDVDRPRAWLLTLDGAPQSYVDLDDPGQLEFEYVRRMAHVLDTVATPGEPVRALHVGAGALTLPRYLAATRPGSAQRAVDADGALLALVEEFLPLPAGSGIELVTADAREAVAAARPGEFDVLVSDVFGGDRVPAHLGGLGYAHAAARALRPGGQYLVNLADAAPFAFLGRQVATLQAAFAEVCALAEPSVLRGRRFGNLVLAASQRPLPIGELARRCAADPFPARVVHGDGLSNLRGAAEPVPDGAALPSPTPPDGAFSVG